nr:immunoglobulin light chain junction region [Macaca mulatta]
CIQPLEFPWTF